jgi:hypothetical protein
VPELNILPGFPSDGKYYVKLPGHNIFMHPNLSVVSRMHGLFQSYEEASECIKAYNHRHSQNQNWSISATNITKTETDRYIIKVMATSLYLYTDGWTYKPYHDDKYLESIGITKYFDSYEQAKVTLDWYNKRCNGSIIEEASFQWDDNSVVIDFMSGEYTLFVSHTDNKDKLTWYLPTNEDNGFGLYVTPTGSLEIVKIEHATIFDNHQKALFAKLRYKRLHKE